MKKWIPGSACGWGKGRMERLGCVVGGLVLVGAPHRPHLGSAVGFRRGFSRTCLVVTLTAQCPVCDGIHGASRGGD